VPYIGTGVGEDHSAGETRQISEMDFSVFLDPAEVTIDTKAGFSLLADNLRELSFFLPCGQHNVTFTKRSGFQLKSG